MRIAAALLALLLVASPASAQSLKLPIVVFGASAMTDWTSTTYALSHGCHEDNPTINWLQPVSGTPGVIAAGAAIDVAGGYLWVHFVGRHHPKLAAAGLYVASAFRFTLAARNFSLVHPPR